MNNLILIMTIVFCSHANAYTPTIESLFRNSENRDIEKNTVVVSFKVKQLGHIPKNVEKQESPDKEDSVENLKEEGQDKNIPTETYVKYYFNSEIPGRTRMITSYYPSGSMRSSTAQKVKLIQNSVEFYKFKEGESLPSVTLHSLIHSLVMNKTTNIIELLKNCSTEIKKNSEIVNREKKQLYERYKNYLMTIRDEPSLKDTLVSPLKNENAEEQERIDTILKSSFYDVSKNVNIVKIGKRFLIEFASDGVKARFTNAKHRLRDLELKCENQNLLIELSDYLLFNGVHELPKYIYFRVDERAYLVQFLNVRHLGLQPGKFIEVFKNFQKNTENRDVETIQLPEIIN